MRRQLGGAERISPKKTLFQKNKRNCTVVGVKKGGTHEIFQSSESCVRFKSYTDRVLCAVLTSTHRSFLITWSREKMLHLHQLSSDCLST